MLKTTRSLRLPLAASIATLLAAGTAPAATLTWIDANADNTWSTTAPNWNPGPTPWVQSSDAVFGGTGETVTLGEPITANSLTFNSTGYVIEGNGNALTLLGGTTAANVTVTTAGQTAAISAALSGTGGLYKGGNGTLSLTGTSGYTGLTTVNAGLLSVAAGGEVNGTSGLQINTGATFTNNGTVTLSGASAVDNATSSVSLAVRVGATFNQAAGTLSIASFGASSTTNITGGTMNVSGNYFVGEQTNGPGTINQTGGTVNLTNTVAGSIRLGHWSNANSGIYNLTGGVLDASTSVSDFNIGWDGRGALTVGGGANTATFKARAIRLDQNTANGYTDTLTVSPNGTVEVGSGGISSAEATDVVILNGGTMRAVADSNWASNLTTATGTVSSLDTNGQNLTISGNLTGSGVVSLSSSAGQVNFNTPGTQTISAPLSGFTPINKLGAGTTVLAGTSPYSGALSVTVGTLQVSGALNNAAVMVGFGVTLAGQGTVGNISSSGGGFNLLATPSAPGALTAAGAVDFGSDVASLVFNGPVPLTPFTVLKYGRTTATAANFTLANLASYRAPVITVGANATTVALGNKALTYTGANGGLWDVGATAGFVDATATPSTFYFGDQVTFNDAPGTDQNVTLGATVQPGNLVVNNSAIAYTFTAGSGAVIAGGTPLLKTGTNQLTLAGAVANTFSGGTTISQGTINVQNAGSLGTGLTTLGDAGTGANNVALFLDTNRTMFTTGVVISSSGTGTATLGSRATVTGAANNNYFSNIVLQRDVVFDSNAADRTDYNNISGTGNIKITGSGRTIFSAANTFIGNIDIATTGAGNLQPFAANTLPDTASITIEAGARLNMGVSGDAFNALNGSGTLSLNTGAAGTFIISLGASGGSGTYSGVAQNNSTQILALTKAGAGTETFTGVNTFTGNIVVSGGTLEIGGAGQLGSGNYAGTITTAGTFLYSSSAAQTLSGIISGAGGLSKSGAGALTLTGANTYTGANTITGGTVVVGPTSGTTTATLGTGATSLAAGAALTYYRSNTYTVPNSFSGAGALVFNGTNLGSGTTVNGVSEYTLTGTNSAFSGTLNVTNARVALDTPVDVGTAALSTGANGTLYITAGTYSNPLTLSGSGYGEAAGQLGALRLVAGTLNGAVTLAGDTRITTYGGTGNSVLAGGIGGGAFGVEFGGIGTGANATILTLGGTSTYTGSTGIGSASAPATVNLTGALGGTAVTVYPGSTLGGGGSIATGGSLTFAAGATTLGVNAALPTPLTVNGSVSTLGTAGQITVAISPGARLAPGTPLTILTTTGASDAVASDFTLANAASYRTAVFNSTPTAVTVDLGTKALTYAGGGTPWDVNATQSFVDTTATLSTFFQGDRVTFDDSTFASQTVPLSGVLQPAAITVNNSNYTYTFTASAGNIIGGAAALLKTGSNTLTMAGNVANTFSGGTKISQGAINVQNAGSLGTGTITLGDAGTGSANVGLYLDTNRSIVTNPVVISSNGTGTATLGSRSTITTSGANNTFSNITLQRDVVLDSNASDRTDYTGISGTGNITVTGLGRTIFSAANTFTGNLTINLGSSGNATFQSGVLAGSVNFIPDTTNVTIIDTPGNAQAEFRLSSTAESINGLNGNGTIDTNSVTGVLTVGAANGSGTFSGTVQNGSAAFTLGIGKAGTGTQVFSGASSYTGPTTVSGGTLSVSGSLTGTSGLSVSNAAILLLAGGSEGVNDAATLTLSGTGSTLKLAGTAQTETLKSLTLSAGAVIDFGGSATSTASGNSLIFGTLAASGTALTIQHWSGSLYSTTATTDAGAAGQDRLLFTTNPTEAMASLFSFYSDSGTFLGTGHAIAYSGPGASYEIVPVPEPSALGGGVALLALTGLRRRRRSTRQGK